MFERAIQEDLKYIEAWNRRGNILDELGDTVRALQSYDQALQVDAHFAPAWSGKAGILRQQGHYFDALKAYNFALDIDPSFTLAWNGKGNTMSSKDKTSKCNGMQLISHHNQLPGR